MSTFEDIAYDAFVTLARSVNSPTVRVVGLCGGQYGKSTAAILAYDTVIGVLTVLYERTAMVDDFVTSAANTFLQAPIELLSQLLEVPESEVIACKLMLMSDVIDAIKQCKVFQRYVNGVIRLLSIAKKVRETRLLSMAVANVLKRANSNVSVKANLATLVTVIPALIESKRGIPFCAVNVSGGSECKGFFPFVLVTSPASPEDVKLERGFVIVEDRVCDNVKQLVDKVYVIQPPSPLEALLYYDWKCPNWERMLAGVLVRFELYGTVHGEQLACYGSLAGVPEEVRRTVSCALEVVRDPDRLWDLLSTDDRLCKLSALYTAVTNCAMYGLNCHNMLRMLAELDGEHALRVLEVLDQYFGTNLVEVYKGLASGELKEKPEEKPVTAGGEEIKERVVEETSEAKEAAEEIEELEELLSKPLKVTPKVYSFTGQTVKFRVADRVERLLKLQNELWEKQRRRRRRHKP